MPPGSHPREAHDSTECPWRWELANEHIHAQEQCATDMASPKCRHAREDRARQGRGIEVTHVEGDIDISLALPIPGEGPPWAAGLRVTERGAGGGGRETETARKRRRRRQLAAVGCRVVTSELRLSKSSGGQCSALKAEGDGRGVDSVPVCGFMFSREVKKTSI